MQLEGGPCGVLAPIQALLMKHLLFPQGEASPAPRTSLSFTSEQRNRLEGHPRGWRQQGRVTADVWWGFGFRALVEAMAETLWRAGSCQRVLVASVRGKEEGVSGGNAEQEEEEVGLG